MKTFDNFTTQLPEFVEKNKNYVLLVGLLTILFVDYFLIMRPQIGTIIKLSPRVSALIRDINTVNEKIGKIDLYQQQVVILKEDVKNLERRILSDEDIPKVLERISRIANKTEIRINQIMPINTSKKLLWSKEGVKYYSLPLRLTAKGGYHSIGRFFNYIETDEVFMSVVDFSISSNNVDPMRHAMNATIKAFIAEKAE